MRYATLALFAALTAAPAGAQRADSLDVELGHYAAIVYAYPDGGTSDSGFTEANAPVLALDLNANGLYDYVTASWRQNEVFVYYDLPTFSGDLYPIQSANLTIRGSGQFGRTFEKGDLNGDGVDDLIVGAIARNSEGAAYVFFGGSGVVQSGTVDAQSAANVVVGCNGNCFNGTNETDALGWAVATPDLNNDGRDDLVLGAPEFPDGTGEGRIAILYGRPSWPASLDALTESDVVVRGARLYDHAGLYLRKGDLDGDGVDDLVLTSPLWPGPGSGGNKGKAWILYGGTSLPTAFTLDAQGAPPTSGISGSNQSDMNTYAVVGDYNGDRTGDLAIGVTKADHHIPNVGCVNSSFDVGAVRVLLGPITRGGNFDVASHPNQVVVRPYPSDLFSVRCSDPRGGEYNTANFGRAISFYDTNGDGQDELLVGAPNYGRLKPQGQGQTAGNEGGAFLYGGGQEGALFAEQQSLRFLANTSQPTGNPNLPSNTNFGWAVSLVPGNNGRVFAAVSDPAVSTALSNPYVGMIYTFEVPGSTTPSEPEAGTAETLGLRVYPNPSAGDAEVLLNVGVPSWVEVAVYDALGRRVAVLHNGALSMGEHRFGLTGAGLPPGVYLVRATEGSTVVVKRLAIAR